MKTIFITYSNGEHYSGFAKNLAKQASEQFDEVIHYTIEDVKDLKISYSKIWEKVCQKTGCNTNGFWMWKPSIIEKTLTKAKDGDIIVYCDAKYFLKGNLCTKIKGFFIKNNPSYVLFLNRHHFTSHQHLEINYTKGDAFNSIGIKMEPDDLHAWAGFAAFRASEDSLVFVREWLRFCTDESVITDHESIFPNHPNFIQHRYDQSVFSLLLKKFKINSDDYIQSLLCDTNTIHRL